MAETGNEVQARLAETAPTLTQHFELNPLIRA